MTTTAKKSKNDDSNMGKKSAMMQLSDMTKSAALYIPSLLSSLVHQFRATVYDTVILKLTKVWYKTVLLRLKPNSSLLDVGIGTAGALIACSDIVKEKKIRIVGIDYDAAYVTKAQSAISTAGMADYISVVCMSVYDIEKRRDELKFPSDTSDDHKPMFDGVYFSGSFSLLPDPVGALRAVVKVLDGFDGKIYITQTYQRMTIPLLAFFKPLLWYFTTIDFGKLITEQQAKNLFAHQIHHDCHLDLVEHSVIPNSVDSYLQAAYITILQPQDIV